MNNFKLKDLKELINIRKISKIGRTWCYLSITYIPDMNVWPKANVHADLYHERGARKSNWPDLSKLLLRAYFIFLWKTATEMVQVKQKWFESYRNCLIRRQAEVFLIEL